MKKEDLWSLLVYALMIVIAIVVGFTVIARLFSDYGKYFPGGSAGAGFAFLFVIVAVIFNAFYLEIGHVVGAKVGKYRIRSFNVLGLCFYRQENKWKFKFSNFDGLTGETVIAPKAEKTIPKAFALFPLIFYTIEVAFTMVIFYVGANLEIGALRVISVLLIVCITVGGMLELYNIFPAHLDSTTDGYRLVILSKKSNIEAYNELMRIEAAYMDGISLNDMKVFDEITDFTSQVNLYTVYQKLEEKKIDEAETLIDKIIAGKENLHKETYCSALAQKMYLILMNRPYEEAKKYYDEHITAVERRFISNDISMQSIRAYLLISAILDISEHEARYAISHVQKALKRTLPGRIKIEKELYELALDKVDEVRPEWKIKEKEIQ